MTEHRIRLARAWSQRFVNLPPSRVDLPAIWTAADQRQPFDLVRQFQRPPIDPACQGIDLELIDAPGLRTVWFNGGQPLEIGRAGDGEPTRVKLDALLQPGRNHLQLAVDLTGVDPAWPWGIIALVIVGDPVSWTWMSRNLNGGGSSV